MIVAGETSNCFPIGDVTSSADSVTRALLDMQCNKCGLVDGLGTPHRRLLRARRAAGAVDGRAAFAKRHRGASAGAARGTGDECDNAFEVTLHEVDRRTPGRV